MENDFDILRSSFAQTYLYDSNLSKYATRNEDCIKVKENHKNHSSVVSCTAPGINRSGYLYDKKTGTGRKEKD